MAMGLASAGIILVALTPVIAKTLAIIFSIIAVTSLTSLVFNSRYKNPPNKALFFFLGMMLGAAPLGVGVTLLTMSILSSIAMPVALIVTGSVIIAAMVYKFKNDNSRIGKIFISDYSIDVNQSMRDNIDNIDTLNDDNDNDGTLTNLDNKKIEETQNLTS